MTTKPSRAVLGTTLATLLLTATACADSEKENDMTPDQALSQLRDAAQGLLSAAAPDNEVDELEPRSNIPCGGLGGNEFIKVKHSYVAAAGIVDDAEAALDAAEAQLNALGLESGGRNLASVGPTLSFAGEGFRGDLMVRESGSIQVRAQTDCLDNPNL